MVMIASLRVMFHINNNMEIPIINHTSFSIMDLIAHLYNSVQTIAMMI